MTILYIDPLPSNTEEPRDYVEHKYMSSSSVINLSEIVTVMETLYLGAIQKLRKATISVVISVCLSVRPSARPSIGPSARNNAAPVDGFL
jgi:hypothetical protein